MPTCSGAACRLRRCAATRPTTTRCWLSGASITGPAWVKLAAAYRSWPEQRGTAAREAAQALLQAFGARRLVWGSDWPNTQHQEVADYASTHAALADWVPDAAERQRILVDTPSRLFHFV